jgi:hypothetical protein
VPDVLEDGDMISGAANPSIIEIAKRIINNMAFGFQKARPLKAIKIINVYRSVIS